MSENSKIEWTDHTFNPWIGCTKVSQGCAHCYAETLMDYRYGRVKWGPQGTRVRTSAANWKKPLKWNKQQWFECQKCSYRFTESDRISGLFGKICQNCKDQDGDYVQARQRVFCASLADVFEDRPELVDWRQDLFDLIFNTQNLDWLLLTKRPENVNRMFFDCVSGIGLDWGNFPNVWIGTSIEDQEAADKRIHELLNIPAKVRFLSAEPLLGHVDILYSVSNSPITVSGERVSKWLQWVIVGGESGQNARSMKDEWARFIRDQCQETDVPLFMKQMGGTKKPFREIPDDLLIREYPIVEVNAP